MSVPTEHDWTVAVALLEAAPRVALACHVSPDGDALGAMLGLGAALRARGTDVVASWGGEPFELPATYSYLPATDLLVPPSDFPAAPDLLVTLDTASADRLGSLQDRLGVAGQVLVVDHHGTNTGYGTAHLVDAAAAATVVLVAELLDRLGLAITAEVASPLYTGLVTDTGSFRYAATTPAVHELAARLLGTGVRPDLISRALYDTAPLAYVRLLGDVCARAQLEPRAVDGLGLVWTSVTADDLDRHGVALAEVEGVIDVVRLAQEAEVAVVLKQEPDRSAWKVSTRSKGVIDVGQVCMRLGGGGHRFAAGFTSTGDAETTLRRLCEELAGVPHLPA